MFNLKLCYFLWCVVLYLLYALLLFSSFSSCSLSGHAVILSQVGCHFCWIIFTKKKQLKNMISYCTLQYDVSGHLEDFLSLTQVIYQSHWKAYISGMALFSFFEIWLLIHSLIILFNNAIYIPLNLSVATQNKDFEGPEGEYPPLLMKVHGGPTSACSPCLDLNKQFFTSRGFALLDVDYRGSTGYGTEYRNSLKKKWVILVIISSLAHLTHLLNLSS